MCYAWNGDQGIEEKRCRKLMEIPEKYISQPVNFVTWPLSIKIALTCKTKVKNCVGLNTMYYMWMMLNCCITKEFLFKNNLSHHFHIKIHMDNSLQCRREQLFTWKIQLLKLVWFLFLWNKNNDYFHLLLIKKSLLLIKLWEMVCYYRLIIQQENVWKWKEVRDQRGGEEKLVFSVPGSPGHWMPLRCMLGAELLRNMRIWGPLNCFQNSPQWPSVQTWPWHSLAFILQPYNKLGIWNVISTSVS